MTNSGVTYDFESLFDNLPARCIVFDIDAPNYTILAQNKLHAEVSFAQPGAAIGKPVLVAYPDTSPEYIKTGKSALIQSIAKVAKTGEVDNMVAFRYDVFNEQGKPIVKYWQASHHPYLVNGKVVAVIQMTNDVTETVVSDEKLAVTERQLDQALSAGLVATWLFDVKSDVVIADKNLSNLFGIDPADGTAGLPLSRFIEAIYSEDRERVIANITRALKTGKRFEAEYRTISNKGKVTWVIARGQVTKGKNGEPESFPGVIVDISERKELEERLRQANENLEHRVEVRTKQLEAINTNLERVNQELQDFAYVASHDLQEPLRKIQAFSDLLKEEYSPQLGDGKDYVERMSHAASRMSTLITDLLEFSRITTQAKPYTKVNLSTVVKEVIGDLETRITDTGGTVKVGRLPIIDADEFQMRQLFQNLIGNALKFHKPGEKPVVTIAVSSRPGKTATLKSCQISVSDNGIGFDEKYSDRIFSVFQRLHGRDIYEGTGIGLAVCRKIVERHSGTLSAQSKPGEGATFIIKLPLHGKRKQAA